MRWPGPDGIGAAAGAWATEVGGPRSDVVRVGLLGSYARGDWGVGRDLDLIAVVDDSDAPFERRALRFDLLGLPGPADLLVYTVQEWDRLLAEGGRFARVVAAESGWLYEREG